MAKNFSLTVPVWDMRLWFDPNGDRIEAKNCGRPEIYLRLPIYQPAPAELAVFAGRYRNTDLCSDYIVELGCDGKLLLQMRGELGHNEAWLEPIAVDTFLAHATRPDWGPSQPTIRFHWSGAGDVQAITVTTDRAKRVYFEREREGMQ